LTNNLVLIHSKEDLKKIPKSLIDDSETKIFSFNVESHKILDKNNITHEIADEILKYSERLEIFDFSVRIHNWFNHEKLNELFNFQNVNILGVLDGNEFQSLIVKSLLNLIIIEKIISKEKPEKIFAGTSFEEYLKIIKKNNIIFDLWLENNDESTLWDKISFKKNIGKIPLSFNISRRKYQKIKKIVEKTVCSSLNLWFNFKDINKETILFLEFDPEQYSELFLNLSKIENTNVVCCNIRNPAFRDLAGGKILKKFNIKMLDYEKLISKQDNEQISNSYKIFVKKLENIFDEKFLYDIFMFQNLSIWPIIRKKILEIFNERVIEYMKIIIISKEIIQKINLKSIVLLNEIGEIEKTIINSNSKQIPIILLQHGYTDYNHETSRFDYLSGYSNISNKIAVWGETQKNYLMKEKKLSSEKILVIGSPKHDKFFKSNEQNVKEKKTILLAPRPITEISGEDNIELHIRYEKILKKIYQIIKNSENVDIIIKLHPIQLGHNEELVEFFKSLDSKLHVDLFSSVKDIMKQSDAVISISPENWDLSTIVLESQILDKPTLNIFLNEKTYEFQCINDNSVLSMTDSSDIQHGINEILFNESTINNLKQNAKKHLKSYLVNHGTASQKFAKILNS
tara:strand:+ start:8568 stop:10451 length:1884 start_codon:yes stop_codon:yes gene_type:complete